MTKKGKILFWLQRQTARAYEDFASDKLWRGYIKEEEMTDKDKKFMRWLRKSIGRGEIEQKHPSNISKYISGKTDGFKCVLHYLQEKGANDAR